MSLSQLKNLFIVGLLGFALVGCSSTPTAEEGQAVDAQAVAAQAEKDAAAKKAAEMKAAEDAALAQADSAKQKQKDLLAALQGKTVSFEFDRSEIKPDFYEVIKMNADYLSMNASATVTVKGYCDERGSREYNLALGERRANAVKNALIAVGISPSRINTVSYGEENPIAMGSNEAAWSQNRRAEFAY